MDKPSILGGLKQLAYMALESAKEKVQAKLGRIPATFQLIKAERLMEEFTSLAKSADQLAEFGDEEFAYPPMLRSTAKLILGVLTKEPANLWFTWTIRYDLEPAMLLHIARAEMDFEDQLTSAASVAEVDGFVTAFERLISYKWITPETVVTLARNCARATNWEAIMKREMAKSSFRFRHRPHRPIGGWTSAARNDHH